MDKQAIDETLLARNLPDWVKSKIPFDTNLGLIVPLIHWKISDLDENKELELFKTFKEIPDDYCKEDDKFEDKFSFLGKIRSQLFIHEDGDPHIYIILQRK